MPRWGGEDQRSSSRRTNNGAIWRLKVAFEQLASGLGEVDLQRQALAMVRPVPFFLVLTALALAGCPSPSPPEADDDDTTAALDDDDSAPDDDDSADDDDVADDDDTAPDDDDTAPPPTYECVPIGGSDADGFFVLRGFQDRLLRGPVRLRPRGRLDALPHRPLGAGDPGAAGHHRVGLCDADLRLVAVRQHRV